MDKNMSKNKKKKKQEEQNLPEQKNLLEWIVFGISLLFIVSLLGYLVYQSILYKPSSPDLVITYEHDPSPNSPFRFHVVIANEGFETAEEVHMELVQIKDGEEVEKATMTIPFSPQQSQREGWVIFTKDPTSADSLYARVISYKKP